MWHGTWKQRHVWDHRLVAGGRFAQNGSSLSGTMSYGSGCGAGGPVSGQISGDTMTFSIVGPTTHHGDRDGQRRHDLGDLLDSRPG